MPANKSNICFPKDGKTFLCLSNYCKKSPPNIYLLSLGNIIWTCILPSYKKNQNIWSRSFLSFVSLSLSIQVHNMFNYIQDALWCKFAARYVVKHSSVLKYIYSCTTLLWLLKENSYNCGHTTAGFGTHWIVIHTVLKNLVATSINSQLFFKVHRLSLDSSSSQTVPK